VLVEAMSEVVKEYMDKSREE
jgi:hypothetical protein